MKNNHKFLEEISGKKINFLFGSGINVPFIKTLSLMKLDNGKSLSLEDLLSDPNVTEESRRLLYVYYYNNYIKTMDLDENNIDDTERDCYLQILKKYKRFVTNAINYLSREAYEQPKRINIFTTNYDLFFEKAFDIVSKGGTYSYFNDGSRGLLNKVISIDNYHLNVSHSGFTDKFRYEIPTINLYKIHGSINWTESTQNGEEYIKVLSEMPNNIDVAVFQDNINLLEEIFNSDSLTYNEVVERINVNSRDISQNRLDDFYEEYKKIKIINPEKHKFNETVFEEHYYQLLKEFSYELEKDNSVLFVGGFSFADEHITNIMKRVIKNPKLKVFCICYEFIDEIKIKNKFESFNTNNITFLPLIDEFMIQFPEEEELGITKNGVAIDNYMESYVFILERNEKYTFTFGEENFSEVNVEDIMHEILHGNLNAELSYFNGNGTFDYIGDIFDMHSNENKLVEMEEG